MLGEYDDDDYLTLLIIKMVKENVNGDEKHCDDNNGKNYSFENEKTINDNDRNCTDDEMIGARLVDNDLYFDNAHSDVDKN